MISYLMINYYLSIKNIMNTISDRPPIPNIDRYREQIDKLRTQCQQQDKELLCREVEINILKNAVNRLKEKLSKK